MKRTLRIVAAALLALAIVLSVFPANASDYYPDKTGKYTVTYTSGTPGKYYSLVIVEGNYLEAEAPEFTEDNIIYIDQVTADANGYAEFASFSPMRGVDGTAYLGGTTPESPILLGLVSAKAPEFVYGDDGVVIEYNGLAKDVVVPEGVKKIKDASVFEGMDITSIRMPVSIEEVLVGLEGVRQYYSAKSGLVFDATLLGEQYFIIGDLNNDGNVDAADLRLFLQNRAKGETPADEIQYDYDGDGNTSLKDASDIMKDIAE